MTKIKVVPYIPIEQKDFQVVELDLKNPYFAGVAHKEGKTELFFSNCRFQKLTIKNSDVIKFKNISVLFWECYIGDLLVEQFESDNISLGFSKSIISGKIECSKVQTIDFNNCLADSMFVIRTPRVSIRYTKENITEDHWTTLCKILWVKGAEEFMEKDSRFYLYGVRETFCSSNFEGESRKRFQPIINIKYEKDVEDKSTRLNELYLKSLSISGEPKGKIFLENLHVDRWFIYEFYPQNPISFYNIQPVTESSPETKIGIHLSNLDSVWFDSIAFDKYTIISFFRTRFSKAIFTSCDFPENSDSFKFMELANVHYPEERPRNFDKAQYEIILQMKKAMEDTGNFHEAQKLQAIAHDALKKIKAVSWRDKTILCINGKSNGHGISISRPFIGFFLFSIPIYIIYLWTIDRIFQSTPVDYNLIGYYFSFVDITHRTDFLVKVDIPGWALFWDWVGKLFVGFFIYQFIAAFRKYGKR